LIAVLIIDDLKVQKCDRAWLTMGFDRNLVFFAKIGTIGKN
jgi:hypothetical protein